MRWEKRLWSEHTRLSVTRESHDNPTRPRDPQCYYYYYYYYYCAEEQPSSSSETREYWNECASSLSRVFLLKILLNKHPCVKRVFGEKSASFWKVVLKKKSTFWAFCLPWREKETEREHAGRHQRATNNNTLFEHKLYFEKKRERERERSWARTTTEKETS